MRDELDLWADAGLSARLWLRDDDAVAPTGQLNRLAGLADRFGLAMLLAVVPGAATESLGRMIEANPLLDVAVHGYRHLNHAVPGEKSIELGGERPAGEICQELAVSSARLRHLFAKSATNILVPPWNRIRADIVEQLPGLGFTALSTFGAASEAEGIDGLKQINTHLDIIDWKTTRGGRDPGWLASEFVKLLRSARECRSGPIGVLTHHLVHDDTAWEFLENLFTVTRQHPGAKWYAAADLT